MPFATPISLAAAGPPAPPVPTVTAASLALPLAVLLVIAGLLARTDWLRPAAWRRGPERRLDLSPGRRVIAAAALAACGGGAALLLSAAPAARDAGAALVTLGQVGGVAAFLAFAAASPAGWRVAGLLPRRPGRDLKVGLLGTLAGTPLTLAVGAVIAVGLALAGRPPDPVNHTSLSALLERPTAGAVLNLLLFAAVLAPVLEELVFRGLAQTLLLDLLGRRRRGLTVGLASLLFALIHAPVVAWYGWPGLFVLGVVLGAVYERTGSLLPCVIIHGLFNAANVGLALLTARPAG